jgi:ribosomal protein S12 methylthiotransferase accessory factor
VLRPALKSRFSLEVVEGEGAFLIGEGDNHLLAGALYCALAPLLDGSATTEEIVDRLADEADPAEIYYALGVLEDRGLLTEGGGKRDARAAYWEALDLDPAVAERNLANARVEVIGDDEFLAGEFRTVLSANGIRSETPGELDVVLTDDYLAAELRERNARAVRARRPWLLVKPFGVRAWIGPLFVPGETGCWECLAQRLRGHRRIADYIERRKRLATAVAPPRAELPGTIGAALHLAATQLAGYLAGNTGSIVGAVLSLDAKSLELVRHKLVRWPQCPTCGVPSRSRTADGLHLQNCRKEFRGDGRHGVVTPQETLARYGHHVSPITGPIASLTPLSGGDSLPHTVLAGHNFAFPAHDLRALRRGLRSSSSGKGTTETQARASALCEALERYSGLFRGDEARVTASYRQLGLAAVHPARCLLFSDKQYLERSAWNSRDSQFSRVPLPVDEAAQTEWSPAWSLTENAQRWLLTTYCYYGHRNETGKDPYCWADSNGCAAGNSIEEAILQGFLELVERDAVALWWYNRLHRPGVDLDSFAHPWLGALREHHVRIGRSIWALDLTNDLGIPVFAAISCQITGERERILFGFGAHLDPQAALIRATTELNQCLMRATTGGADRDDAVFGDEDFRAWWRGATRAAHTYLLPDPSVPARGRSTYPDHASDDLLEDILHCRKVVEDRGMEVIVLDQTRPDIGLPVVRVVVPGLRHFWPRFAPGRLYDAPVECGALKAPLTEAELNPVTMFI